MANSRSVLVGASVGLLTVLCGIFLLRNSFTIDRDQDPETGESPVEVELVADEGDKPSPARAVPLEPYLPVSGADSMRVPDEKEVMMQKILVLVGTEEIPIHTLYADATSGLDRECLPLLRDMLKDPAYKNRWRSISSMLAWLSDSRDEASLNAILAYIRRPDLWKDADASKGHGYVNVYGKAAAVGLLGFFELDSATSTLRRAFTKEGAEELIGTWVNVPHAVDDYSASYTVESVRMQAASGLALSQDAANIALIEAQIEALAHWTWSDEYEQSEDADDVMESSLDGGIPYHSLADAMTRLDRIRDVGLEEFLLHDDTSDGFGLKMPYALKYWGQRLPNGRTVLDPCPICGTTRRPGTREISN
ncbi:MAG: hypothetical protein JNK74_19380 [Candidatus Hydrogenedentes bacterium]|nr:hypothetical protein [Candidatus Hydrogenedentota bacterium]